MATEPAPSDFQELEDEAHAAREMFDSTWSEVELGPILAGDLRPPTPEILRRNDGRALLYRGKTHMLLGEFESGKSWLAAAAVAETIRAARHALYVDFEDSAEGFARRLLNLGASPAEVLGFVHYVCPAKRLEGAAIRALVDLGDRYRPVLVVIDGVTEAMALHGWNPDKADDVARFYDLMPRRWDRTRAAVVLIDHVVKAKDERGRYALGSQHKMSGINGAAYRLDPDGPLQRGRPCSVRITVTKDREGSVRAVSGDGGKFAGTMWLRPMPDLGPDGLEVTIEAPSYEDDQARFGLVKEKVLAWLREQPEAVTQTRVEEAELGDRADVRSALAALVAERLAECNPGPRRAKLYRAV